MGHKGHKVKIGEAFRNGVAYLALALFTYAAISKLLDYPTFTVQLAQSPLLSVFAGTLAWAVPVVEIVVALALLVPRYRQFGLYGFFTMMAFFTAYIAYILEVADFVPCSCGGVLEKLGWGEHLAFNVGWSLTSAAAICIRQRQRPGRSMLSLVSLMLFACTSITILYATSEKKIHRNNAFQRRYVPHPIEKIEEFALDYDSYYLAGFKSPILYLGNYNAPLYLTLLNVETGKQTSQTLTISYTNLPYRKVKVSVCPPYFFLGDGTVPVLFRGDTLDWIGSRGPKDIPYFATFQPMDSVHVGIVTVDPATKKKAVGIIDWKLDLKSPVFQISPLATTSGKPFEGDGVLLWNPELQEFIYTYFYKNSIEILTSTLQSKGTQKTIDTVTHPDLDVGYSETEDRYTLGGRSVLINKLATTGDQYLFINSDRLGRFEDPAPLRSASIVDVYDIEDQTYAFSFYLYHQKGDKLYEFQLYGDMLIAITGQRAILYRLRPEWFPPRPSPKHTAQYQE